MAYTCQTCIPIFKKYFTFEAQRVLIAKGKTVSQQGTLILKTKEAKN